MTMDEVLRIKSEISKEIKDLSDEEFIAYFKRSGEKFDQLMDELKQKWTKEKVINVS